MGRLGMTELLLIALVVLLLFGAQRLPDIAKALGQAIKEFKKASKDDGHDQGSKDSKA